MQQNWRWASALVLAVASSGAMADSLDISLNDKTLRAIYAVTPPARRGLELDFGHYSGENNSSVTHAGLHVSGENWSQRGVFDVGLGGRVIYVSTKPASEAALAFGGRLRFSPVQRLGFGANAYYAPQVTTFMDGKNYLEAGISVDYQILPQGFLYVGYREIRADYKTKGSAKLDQHAHVGMKLVF